MTAAQFSSDGRFLAAGGGHGGLHLWDTGSGQYLGHHAGTPGRIMSCDWRADGGRIATGDDLGFVHLWHPRFSGGYLHLGRHWGDVGAFDAYGSGDSAVSASRDGSVIIWDVAHAEARRFIADPTSAVMDVKVLPGESSVVALCGSTELMAWDLESTQLLLHDITETPARNRVRGIVMDPDQDRFFIGLRAQEGHSKGGLEVWSASTLERLRILEVGDEALSVLGAPASVEFLVAGTEAGHLLILHPETGAILERIPLPEGVGTIRGVDVSADGRWVLANDWQAKMYLVNVEARRLERVLSLDEDIIHCAVFAQGGKRVIAGTRGGQIGVWDPATGQHLSNIDVLKHWIVALFFDGATDRLFVGGAEGSVEVYDLMSAQERMRRSEAAPTRGEDTLALRYDSEFSAHAVETAWRGLLDGSPGGFDSAERMLFFLSRGTYHEAAVAGLKGAIQLARGDREGAQRQLQFALQSEALGEKRKSELRTLLVLASLGTGSPWSPEPDAGPIDGHFLERWKRAFEDRSSK
jgi:WD40 repeat protein